MLLVVVALLLAASGLGAIAVVHRSARAAVDDLLQRRLEAVGVTAARLLGVTHDSDSALAEIATANELDGAYVVDAELMILADAHGQRGRRANLLRLDADRARAALAGQASVGRAFDVEGATFLGGYFPLNAAARQALVLEAGTSFQAPSHRLRVAAATAYAVAGALVLLALVAIAGAARAARREREAFGEAERAGMASRMAAMVAHEVRNPLLTISGAAELLRERTTAARDRELIDDLLGEVQRINALTNEFLTLSRESPLERSRVDVGALARDVCAAVALRYGSLQLVAEGDAQADADAAKLRQALLNLVLNAAQAVGAAGHVRVDTRDGDGVVRVRVSDDGPGVAPEMAARLFEPFATAGKATGTGLGLAVARKIVEQHGGTLRHAPSSRGACFELTLPHRPEAT